MQTIANKVEPHLGCMLAAFSSISPLISLQINPFISTQHSWIHTAPRPVLTYDEGPISILMHRDCSKLQCLQILCYFGWTWGRSGCEVCSWTPLPDNLGASQNIQCAFGWLKMEDWHSNRHWNFYSAHWQQIFESGKGQRPSGWNRTCTGFEHR